MRFQSLVIVILAGAGLLGSLACSANTRYRVLAFFFDGVPEPGRVPESPAEQSEGDQAGIGPIASPPRTVVQLVVHQPYRDNRCASCHDISTGGMVRSIADGLCLMCHAPIVQAPRFLHGPVAVNECTFCHHYHFSSREGLLIEEEVNLCLGCHDRDDLTTGEHHDSLDSMTCTGCHDPHGGDNPFFTRRKGP